MATKSRLSSSKEKQTEEAVSNLTRVYYDQLTQGCKNKSCTNPYCATGSGKPLPHTEAGATAMRFAVGLVTDKLCIYPTPIIDTNFHNSPAKTLNNKIKNLQEVCNELLPAHNHWFVLGLALGLPNFQMKIIQSNHPGIRNNSVCLREMLSHWLKLSSSPTWTVICKALRHPTVNLIDLAGEIEGKITGPSQDTGVNKVLTTVPPPSPPSAHGSGLITDITLTAGHVRPLFKVLFRARDSWYFIGEGIRVSEVDLIEIENRHRPDKTRCLHEMLQHRIQQGGLTRSMLCQSLREKSYCNISV